MSASRSRRYDMVDAIDLTGSPSPPPPQPSRSRPPLHQARMSSYLNGAHRTVPYMSSRSSSSSRPPPPTPNAPPGMTRSAKRVRPEAIARIIDTSPPDALRTVLLELCEHSPALCGALTRGLALHSTYAQSLVRDRLHAAPSSIKRDPDLAFGRPSPANNIKPDPNPDMTRRLHTAGPHAMPTATPAVKRDPGARFTPTDDSDSGDSLLSMPEVRPLAQKRKQDASVYAKAYIRDSDDEDDEADDDDDEDDFPVTQRRRIMQNNRTPVSASTYASSSRAPLRDISGGMSPASTRLAPITVGLQTGSQGTEARPADKTPVCLRCGEACSPGGQCFYHPDAAQTLNIGTKTLGVYACCGKTHGTKGCATQPQHTSDERVISSALDGQNRPGFSKKLWGPGAG
ncbi:hypothetical protein BS50DRAFT_586742 [Corynespora cassiicola Philippines]|uniref:Uncharacterized protein n=1 Tax=Corynespora cassiicola Philippines TaxID=1448308 RepID=A0A2T2NVH3_CORCC|nr:hypothetical protein BS50DRAFT_586742 [Corynespora cassiicola Philippines]